MQELRIVNLTVDDLIAQVSGASFAGALAGVGLR
jgi:hypothetical protein